MTSIEKQSTIGKQMAIKDNDILCFTTDEIIEMNWEAIALGDSRQYLSEEGIKALDPQGYHVLRNKLNLEVCIRMVLLLKTDNVSEPIIGMIDISHEDYERIYQEAIQIQ